MNRAKTKESPATSAAAVQTDDPIWSQIEQLSLKLGALEVLLFNATGEACDSFNALDEEQREVYLSHCAEMATAAKAEAKRIAHAAMGNSNTDTATA